VGAACGPVISTSMIRSGRFAQATATSISYAFLVCIVTAASKLISNDKSFVSTAILTNAIATATAVSAWTGALFRGRGIQPTDVADWILMFFCGAVMSALSLFIDCGLHLPAALGGVECDGHPGISVLLTIAFLSITAISLPSALRAWLIKKLS